MGDIYKKLQDGSLVTEMSRGVYNETLDMLRWWKTRQQHTGRGRLHDLIDWDQSVFLVKNASESNLSTSYGVLGIDDVLISPTDNESEFLNKTALSGVTPSVSDHAGGKWCVVLEPVRSGEIGRACLVGAVPVRIYVNSYEDKYCDVVEKKTVGEGEDAEDCYLGSGSSGAQILWWEAASSSDDEAIVWALIRLGSASQQSPSSFYQLITDLDGDILFAKANPGTVGETGILTAANGTEDNSNYTVIVLDPTGGQIPAWAGDWIEVEDSSVTVTGYEQYTVKSIKARASRQLEFFGVLASALGAGGSAIATLLINSAAVDKPVYDNGLLIVGDTIAAGMSIRATYTPNYRRFFVTQSSCY